MLGVGGKTEEYEDSNNPNFQIENLVITFYLYKPNPKTPYQPYNQQGQGQKPVPQQQNVIQEGNDPMDDKMPEVDQPPF